MAEPLDIDTLGRLYGRGRYDEASGLYEWYEAPEEVTAPKTSATWSALLDQWELLRWDFAHLLHVDLDIELIRHPWAWFADHVAVLLGHPESMTHHHFKESDV
ncbi:hypothetical protein GCM10022287_21840 [Gryllotalpicola koreensis]|uniref:Uncharacterized protein n=1 Tax=Gryllotalpicola koreensis TaxID=993086 RepID=A0ABP8A1R5_9MICO